MFRSFALACLLFVASPALAGGGSRSGASVEATKEPITWINDDWSAALAKAKATQRPLVVDLWAPWCHTCLAMQHYVLNDPSMAALADRFVWLALDTDKPQNAAALKIVKPEVWPTFYVVDPTDSSIAARHAGGANLDQVRELLRRGEAAMRASQKGLKDGTPISWLQKADRLATAGDYAGAHKAYSAAVKAAPAGWDRVPETLVAQIRCLYRQKAYQACGELAAKSAKLAAKGHSVAGVDFGVYADICTSKQANDALNKQVWMALAGTLGGLTADAAAPLSIDDRSEGLRVLRSVRSKLGDKTGAEAAARAQKKLLDDAVAASRSAEMAMTWGWPRQEVYRFLGEEAALIPWFQGLAKALPTEYDPPYRLASALLNAGRKDDALAAARQAERLAYGPRKGRVLGVIATILEARGDAPAQLAVLEAMLKHYQDLPDGQRRDSDVEAARQAVEAARNR